MVSIGVVVIDKLNNVNVYDYLSLSRTVFLLLFVYI